jgi:cysteine desulfuration protein SufE
MMSLKEIETEEIIENFELLEDWEDKYIYLIELGERIEKFNPDEKKPEYLIEGCVSKVWITKDYDGELLHFGAESESQIVKGLVALLLILFSGKKPEKILKTDEKELFLELDLEAHLSGNRANGLRAIVAQMKKYAREISD